MNVVGRVPHDLGPQVLYFTPPGVNATWDPNLRSHVIPHSQLPLLASSSWPLDPGRTGLPASAAGGPYDGLPYDVAAMPAGLRQISVGEVMLQPVATSGGETAVAAARAAGAPRLLPPQGTESVPPAVLNLVLYAPPAAQRPLALLGADGTRLEHNAYRVDGWGMLQVGNLDVGAHKERVLVALEGRGWNAWCTECSMNCAGTLRLNPAILHVYRDDSAEVGPHQHQSNCSAPCAPRLHGRRHERQRGLWCSLARNYGPLQTSAAPCQSVSKQPVHISSET